MSQLSTKDLVTILDLSREDLAKIFATVREQKPKARATMDGFAPSRRREYVEWITEAKQAATEDIEHCRASIGIAEGLRLTEEYDEWYSPGIVNT